MWHHLVAKELPTRTSRTGNNREAQIFCLARDKFQRARDVKYEDCVDKWMIWEVRTIQTYKFEEHLSTVDSDEH